MPASEKSLKQLNAPYLWSFFCFNLILFFALFFSVSLDNVAGNFKALLTLRTFGICIAPLVLFILNGLLTSNQKAAIVFWRYRNALPGARAFSVHAHNDNRIDIQALGRIHANLPTHPKEQNRLWYKIYKANSDELTVKKSHKDFLLARDLASMSFLFIIFIGIPVLIVIGGIVKWIYLIILLIEYLVMVRLAQNHGKAFVKNVLAVESAK